MTQKPPEKLPQFDVSFVFCVRAERVETQECGLAFRGLLIVETNFQEAKEFLLFSLLLLLQLSRYCVLCVAEAEYKKKKNMWRSGALLSSVWDSAAALWDLLHSLLAAR